MVGDKSHKRQFFWSNFATWRETGSRPIVFHHYINTVPYPRNVWSRYTGFSAQERSPKNSSSTLPNSFFFYQTDKIISFVLNSLKAGHHRCLLLKHVWYDQRKTKRFHKKTCNSYLKTLMSYFYFHWDMQQVTIESNLGPVYMWFKTIDFKSK